MQQQFETVITPKRAWFDLNLKELLRYRDLIVLFVRRTFVSQYKQTVLGPAWAIIQPLLTTVVLTVVFGNIAGLAPAGVPSFAFYLCGSIAWGYFSACLTATSTTFTSNAAILGKVYFPRLVMPISTVLSQLISFAVQFLFFLLFLIYYIATGANVHPNGWILLTPVLLLHLALLSLGVGIIISALTTKYRDLAMVVSFGVQLWMYATPVAYDLTLIPDQFLGLYMLNPVTPVITMFRYAFLGVGEPHLVAYGISWIVTLAVLLLGVMLFNRVEKTFMDTV
ncbi:MAG: ABC transporter permease [Candidatus Spyradocola sp.]|nr:ABC transporter permease [Candidatus Spyradocola sp.]